MQLIDVSELEPPEPLVRTLAAADALPPGEFLLMLHRRDPCLLYDNLKQRDMQWLQQPGREVEVELFIWRTGDHEAESAARACAGERKG